MYTHTPPDLQRRRNPHVNKRKVFLRKHAPILRFALVLMLFTILALILYRMTDKEYFNVKKVIVSGTHNFVNASDLATMAEQQLMGRHILKVEPERTEEILENSFQGAKEIKVYKDWPDEVQVVVSERIPLALIKSKTDEESYLVDDEGYVLGIVDESKTNLPRINYEGKAHVGQFLDKDLVPLYLDLLSTIDEQKLKASSVSVNDEYVNFYLDNKINVLIGKSKDIRRSVLIVSELLNQLKYEGKDVRKIDLRYDKVVVEY